MNRLTLRSLKLGMEVAVLDTGSPRLYCGVVTNWNKGEKLVKVREEIPQRQVLAVYVPLSACYVPNGARIVRSDTNETLARMAFDDQFSPDSLAWLGEGQDSNGKWKCTFDSPLHAERARQLLIEAGLDIPTFVAPI